MQLDALGLDLEALDELVDQALPGERSGRISEVAQRVAELERLSQVDDLTELATRRHWLHTVRKRLADRPHGALLLCDVDRFKEVNDQCGHRAGDLVLTDVARVVDRHGFAGRLGGDEFVLWLNAAPEQAEAVAQEIVSEVDEIFSGDASPVGPVGVSIGVACAPCDGEDLPRLLELADTALYSAKGSGGRRARRLPAPDVAPPALALTGERRFR